MLQKRNLVFVFSAILSLLLVACGATADDGGDADSSSAGSVNLSQSLSFDDEVGGSVTLNYPDGWASNTDTGLITLASSEELITENPDSPESGQVLTSVIVLPPEMASIFVSGGEEVSVVSLANSFPTTFGEGSETFSEVEETTIDGKTAAILTGEIESEDAAISVVIVAIALEGDSYAIILGGTALGESDSIRVTIEAIAGSVSYTAGESE